MKCLFEAAERLFVIVAPLIALVTIFVPMARWEQVAWPLLATGWAYAAISEHDRRVRWKGRAERCSLMLFGTADPPPGADLSPGDHQV